MDIEIRELISGYEAGIHGVGTDTVLSFKLQTTGGFRYVHQMPEITLAKRGSIGATIHHRHSFRRPTRFASIRRTRNIRRPTHSCRHVLGFRRVEADESPEASKTQSTGAPASTLGKYTLRDIVLTI